MAQLVHTLKSLVTELLSTRRQCVMALKSTKKSLKRFENKKPIKSLDYDVGVLLPLKLMVKVVA